MCRFRSLGIRLSTTFLLVGLAVPASSEVLAVGRETDFNFGWKFQLQEESPQKLAVPLIDSDWRDIRLPHDWSVEASFDQTLEGCTGYLPGGVAWYQKHFPTPDEIDNKLVFILFDGVYNNAKFWLHGQSLGENPYGYSPVYFDLTDTLTRDGSENVIFVHVDHSRYADSRWYTGSGLYRNVRLITVDKLHIPIWGTFLTTPEVSDKKAVVQLETKVTNARNQACRFTLSTKIIDIRGQVVAEQEVEHRLPATGTQTVGQRFNLMHPDLWDTDSPHMYKAETTLVENTVEPAGHQSRARSVADSVTTDWWIDYGDR